MTQLHTPRRRRTGLWSAAVAAPVVLGRLAVVVLAAGPLGAWAPIAPLAWLALAEFWLTQPAERLAVHLAHRYHRATSQQLSQLRPGLAVAEARCALTPGEVDLYARGGTGESINAYAAGHRSVAVSEGLLAATAGGKLSPAQVGALLTHELGHLRSRGTRYGISIAWLGAP